MSSIQAWSVRHNEGDYSIRHSPTNFTCQGSAHARCRISHGCLFVQTPRFRSVLALIPQCETFFVTELNRLLAKIKRCVGRELNGCEACCRVSAFQEKGPPMLTALVSSIVLGVVLSLRFNVIILVPGIFLTLMIAATTGVARGDGVWSVAGTMAMATAAVQLGYLLGSVLPTAARAKLGSNRGTPPISTGVSRPT